MDHLQPIIATVFVACLAGCADSTVTRDVEATRVAPLLELPGVSRVDFDVLGGVEKVNHGEDIGFWALTGNSTVLLIGPGGGVCTAQVINRFFLLTAAHCIADVTPSGNDFVRVMFTDTSENLFELATVAVSGAQIPGWSQGDNDIGLYFVFDGLDTCQDTLGDCRNTHVNRPLNALFQVYYPGFEYTASKYTFVGYGTTDNMTPDLRLRLGSARISSSFFTEDGFGHMISTDWGADDARPCEGDSGGPLLSFQFSRLLHTGVHSSNGNCTGESGSASYAGLSNDQAIWLLDTMASVDPAPDASFRCGASTTPMPGGSELLAFGCDNDGTIF
ncbi:MAG TPA: trypsin-like serine protease [Polyangiales bacterium]|nr:trypsin-like serine protease [Polyangiales bacterium]